MKNYEATEQAYKNGYEAGVKDATDNNVGHKWIPVTERLPEEDGKYLVHNMIGRGISAMHVVGFAHDGEKVSRYDLQGEKNCWYGYDSEYGYFSINSVTHWMPLPEPPKGE